MPLWLVRLITIQHVHSTMYNQVFNTLPYETRTPGAPFSNMDK